MFLKNGHLSNLERKIRKIFNNLYKKLYSRIDENFFSKRLEQH